MKEESKSAEFGELLRRVRERLGVTQREVGEVVGVSPSYISQVETGDTATPCDAYIEAWCTALGIERDAAFAAAHRVPPELRQSTVIRQMLASVRAGAV